MPFGYGGKTLWVDLTHAELREEPTESYLEWIGGRGLGSFLLSRHQQRGDDSPEREFIVVATGPLVATQLPLGTRTAVIARNRLSGGISYSNGGGDFGNRLKMAGYDAIVIYGVSQTPVYLLLQASKAKLMNAWACSAPNPGFRAREYNSPSIPNTSKEVLNHATGTTSESDTGTNRH